MSMCRNRIPLKCFAAWSRDEMVRRESTSGGIFSLLAKRVFAGGGVVFGAAWDDDMHHVRHISIYSADDLSRIRKSKYVWSEPGSAYDEAESHIAKGRRVLFCGTPCQCATISARVKAKCGDKACLLITVDFVCHGTPPPETFAKYAKALEEREGSKLVAYDFRDKKDGWNFPRIKYRFANGNEKRIIPWLDPYFRDFSLNRSLRECCYKCRFAGIDRPSDITVADCWRVGATHPKWDDNGGCSNVLINTGRGLAFWEEMADAEDVEFHDYDLREAQMRNHSLMEPSKRCSKCRPLFYYWIMYWVKRIGWFYFRRHQ